MEEKTEPAITLSGSIEYDDTERSREERMNFTLELVEDIQSMTREEKVRIIRALILLWNTNISVEQVIRKVGLQ